MINQSQHQAFTLPCPSHQGRGKDWGRKEDKNEWSFIQGHRYNQKQKASKEKKGGCKVHGAGVTATAKKNRKTITKARKNESTKKGL
jgi:hypothetical protein